MWIPIKNSKSFAYIFTNIELSARMHLSLCHFIYSSTAASDCSSFMLCTSIRLGIGIWHV